MFDNRFSLPLPAAYFADVDFLHQGRPTKLNAFDEGEDIILRLRVSRSVGVTSCDLILFDEYISRACGCVGGVYSGLDKGLDIYTFNLTELVSKPSLNFFYIKLSSFDRELYVKKSTEIFISQNPSLDGMFQLTLSEFKYPEPAFAKGGIIYHIFVDRFNRGGEVPLSDGAIKIDGEWEYIPEFPEYPGAPLKNNTFYGGTLYGIAEKLDYLSELGVSIIYLSPIFSSVSNHKYDTADYMTVDEMFGGEDALKELISKAEKKGIKIILDGVFNHTGDDSVYFNKYNRFDSVGAYNSERSPFYPWYSFSNHPDKYTCWWDIPILPRINPDIPECGEFIAGEGGVIEKYMKLGVWGFRLDVADELSDKFLSRIKERLSAKGESLLLGEVWEDASNKVAYGVRKKYYLGAELDGVMNYPVRVGLIDYLVNKRCEKLRYALTEVLNNTPKRIQNTLMNLIGSHDTPRALTALSGVSDEGKSNAEKRKMRLSPEKYETARKRLISAYTVLATIPGIPSVFYADEAGSQGYGDPFCRMPYPWGKEDKTILDHYRSVGKIRRENKVYADGDFELLYISDEILIFERKDKRNSFITVLNNADYNITLSFDSPVFDMLAGKRKKQIKISAEGSVILKTKTGAVFEIFFEE